MKLQIGITKLQPGWEILLRQIGAPYCEINNNNLDPENFAAVIVSGNSLEFKNLADYLNEGGTIIGETDAVSRTFNVKTRNVYVKYFRSPGIGSSHNLPPCDIYKKCIVPAEADRFPNQMNINTWMEHDFGKGRIIFLPSGISSLMNDMRIKRKNFYSQYSRREMNERVSAVSKAGIYHFVESSLENLFHFRGLPFVSLWPFPDGRINIFGFRIDTDFADLNDLKNLYSVCKENNIRASWFVETGSSGDNINFFSSLGNQEIGLHCHRHKIFGSYKENYKNIMEGLRRLKTINIIPAGFASPYGEWNEPLAKVVSDLNFNYSSEFGFAYDSIPFYPYLNNSFSKALQVPIHPISTGRLYWGGHSGENMIKYFEDIINSKLALFEPVIFYTHPGEKRFHIFDSIFKKINTMGINNYTLKEYAEWWEKRSKIIYSAYLENQKINIISSKEDASVWIKAVYPNNEVYISSLLDDINLNKKKIEKPDLNVNSRDDYNRLRKTTPRMKWHDILNAYRKLNQ